MITKAQFSIDRQYRYSLTRLWDDSKPNAIFIGLNPSTADGEKDDPMVSKCMGYAKKWGCGSIYILNLMGYCSTDKKALLEVKDPVGDKNFYTFRNMVYFPGTKHVVACWGNPPESPAILNSIRSASRILLRLKPGVELTCLGVKKSGHPEYPLYLPYSAKLIPYKEPLVELLDKVHLKLNQHHNR